MRYCPSCDLAGLTPYTIWSSVGVWKDQCENDKFGIESSPADHHIYVHRGAYVAMCYTYPARGSPLVAHIAQHAGEYCHCKTIVASLMSALEREARQELLGTFNPAMWALTFPKETIKMVGWSRKAAQAALVSQLPLVLAKIVIGYLWDAI